MVEMVVPSQVMLGERAVLECRSDFLIIQGVFFSLVPPLKVNLG